MLVVDDLDISISRGDNGVLHISMTGDVPENGTTILFSVKKHISDTTPVLEKRISISNAQVIVELTCQDTDIAIGDYWWDLRIIYAGIMVHTPIKPHRFRILEVVGRV